MELTAAEARVLGCLVERQVTAPDEYSLSLDELRFACNQTSGRDPVVAFDDRLVEDTLLSLKSKGLARFVVAGRTRGPVEYRHRADERWRLTEPELAVLAVLLLRGPQTIGQVRAALSDRRPLDPPIDVEAVLDALAGRTPTPFATRLAAAASRGEQRWVEALTDQADIHRAAPEESAPTPEPSAGPSNAGTSSRPGPPGGPEPLPWGSASAEGAHRSSPTLSELADRLTNIERRLAGIETALGALRAASSRSAPPPQPPPSSSPGPPPQSPPTAPRPSAPDAPTRARR
jgi:uncharacterized protein